MVVPTLRNPDWNLRARAAHQVMAVRYLEGVDALEGAEPYLAAALRDILTRPGSLVRAVVAYLIGVTMGMPPEAAGALGCGIEYLHTASLIFDDLPAMDDALLRRGAPCLHIAHGQAIAMLASLALISRGYSLLWAGIQSGDADSRAEAGKWVDAKLGAHGLIGGQAWDLRRRDGEHSTSEVSAVAARKTGDLLRLTMVLPALLGIASQREIQLLDRLALLRGLAYQAADDLKDVAAEDGNFGKTAGRDQNLGRPNLVAAEGFAAARERYARLVASGDQAQAALPGGDACWGMLDLLRVPMPDQEREASPRSAESPSPAPIS